MGLKKAVTKIARDEANRAFRDLVGFQSQKSPCTNLGVVSAVDVAGGKCTVVLEDGSISTVRFSGNRAVGVGGVVNIVNGVIL